MLATIDPKTARATRGIEYVDPQTAAEREAREFGDHEAQAAFYGEQDDDPRDVLAWLREPVPSVFAAD